jgi:hypothetical protein
LVVLHHKHFLPKGSSLTFYTHANNQLLAQNYIVGHGCTLRCSPGTTDSPRLPAFAFDLNPSSLFLNVFLNAEIKF